jgi:hypothetical protein
MTRACLFFHCNEKLFFESSLFLGLPPRIFSRKDELLARKTRPAAFTSLTRVEQLHGALVPFFFIAMKSFFFESSLFLGLPPRIFSRKDELLARKTRAAASGSSSMISPLQAC